MYILLDGSLVELKGAKRSLDRSRCRFSRKSARFFFSSRNRTARAHHTTRFESIHTFYLLYYIIIHVNIRRRRAADYFFSMVVSSQQRISVIHTTSLGKAVPLNKTCKVTSLLHSQNNGDVLTSSRIPFQNAWPTNSPRFQGFFWPRQNRRFTFAKTLIGAWIPSALYHKYKHFRFFYDNTYINGFLEVFLNFFR